MPNFVGYILTNIMCTGRHMIKFDWSGLIDDWWMKSLLIFSIAFTTYTQGPMSHAVWQAWISDTGDSTTHIHIFTHKIRFNKSKIKMAVHNHYDDQSTIWVGLIWGHFYLFSFWKQRKTKQTKGPQISLISVVLACIREPVLIDHHHQIYQEESSFLVAGYSSCVLHWACFWGIRCHKS